MPDTAQLETAVTFAATLADQRTDREAINSDAPHVRVIGPAREDVDRGER